MADVQAVLSALEVFGRAPDKSSLDQANAWLLEFQHSVEAWTTSGKILQMSEAPQAARLFAAQTFRTKITYDLNQLEADQLPALSQSLLSSLQQCTAGPRTVITQLCLSISGLALQFPEWDNVVPLMIQTFGHNPSTVPVLLEFLNVLPDEVTNNTKIPISNEDYPIRAKALINDNAKAVLDMLAMYIQAQGVTLDIQSQIFKTLKSWIISGEIAPTQLLSTPLLGFAFEALSSEALFDSAVNLICEIIHETQEIDDNMNVIEVIVPKVIALRPKLAAVKNDPDATKGFCRIFVEAGETYRTLLLQHTEAFYPIVEAILDCVAYPDLDVVPITFYFWYRLSQSIGKRPSVSPLLLESYRTLLNAIVRHLHFPSDSTSMDFQEAEDFRSFRHVMGDTLKDCCYVLGTDTCLGTAYDLIAAGLSQGAATGVVSWQAIEAPLFSLRSMGAEIDPSDDKVIPKIMDVLPQLPNHPRVLYASTLVLSRYTEWINEHPTYIPFTIQYVTAGFDSSDAEVSAAAGQAIKYLCKDCKKHLVPYLPQLHTFLGGAGARLPQDDKAQVYEAVAHVISSMPMAEAADSLRLFSLELLLILNNFSQRTDTLSKQEIQEMSDTLENLEVMLSIIRSFGDELPTTCQQTCFDAWSFFDPLVEKYGQHQNVSERATRVLRHGLELYGKIALPLMPNYLARMSSAFQTTGNPSYLWLIGKVFAKFGNEEDTALRNAFQTAYEQSTAAVASLLQVKSPSAVPDVVEDYVHVLLRVLSDSPDVFFLSPAFGTAFHLALAGLTLLQADTVNATLRLIDGVITHPAVATDRTNLPPKFAMYSPAIHGAMEKEGQNLATHLMSGYVGDFPEETTADVVAILRAFAQIWPSQMMSWLVPAMGPLPPTSLPSQAKNQFLQDMNQVASNRNPDGVKPAVLGLQRAFRKARDRRRDGINDR